MRPGCGMPAWHDDARWRRILFQWFLTGRTGAFRILRQSSSQANQRLRQPHLHDPYRPGRLMQSTTPVSGLRSVTARAARTRSAVAGLVPIATP